MLNRSLSQNFKNITKKLKFQTTIRMASTTTPVTSETNDWIPPSTINELYAQMENTKFGKLNKPTAGAREEAPLPVGDADFQLYSLGTPNGWKVSILLEKLDIPYDAHKINIRVVLLMSIPIQRFLLL